MRTKKAQPLAEQEIDQIVVAQAREDAAWGNPIRVRKTKTASIPLSSALGYASRVLRVCTAREHRGVDREIIQERLDLEEAAFAGLKRDLATKYRSAQQEL